MRFLSVRVAGLVLLAALSLPAAVAADHSLTQRLSPGNSPTGSFFLGASPDGRHVWFSTTESLVPADTGAGDYDMYRRSGDSFELISVWPGSPGTFLAGATDGSRTLVQTNEQLVIEDTDDHRDIYERAGNGTSLISTGPTDPGGSSFTVGAEFLRASKDAAHVFFRTDQQMTADDLDNRPDFYERFNGTTRLMTVGSFGQLSQLQPEMNLHGASDDGLHFFFTTSERHLAEDMDAAMDVYERQGETIRLVSTGPETTNGPFPATFGGNSPDGTKAYFNTTEPLVSSDTDTRNDTYMREGTTTTKLTPGNGPFDAHGGPSLDGSRVIVRTNEPLLGSDTDASVDLYEVVGAGITLLSAGSVGGNGAYDAESVTSSADGRHVVFRTGETLELQDTDGAPQCEDDVGDPLGPCQDLYESFAGVTKLVSYGPVDGPGNGHVTSARMSKDGSRIFFFTDESLLAADGDSFCSDQYERVRDQTFLAPNVPGCTSILPRPCPPTTAGFSSTARPLR